MNSRANIALGMWWVAWAAAAIIMRLISPGILEGGDGIQHYHIARASWHHPELFLHHWGKPFFTLFASPFAQLGHWGMTLFNACCLLLTAWVADGLLRRSGSWARWMFVPALLLVPVYGTMVFAGMTEVFFGLLTILVLRALLDERYVLAMIIVSFMPFARPEYIAFAPFAFAWVVKERHWRALPFVLTGHVVYGLIGAVVLGDALWAFHNDPYSWYKGIYGHGEWDHFLEHRTEIYGTALLCIMPIAVIAGLWLGRRSKDDRPILKLLFFVGLLPSLVVILVHSILWWKGWKGSLGLLRVIATSAPLLILCMVWILGRAGQLLVRKNATRLVVMGSMGVLYIWWAAVSFLAVQPLPVVPWPYDQFVRDVGEHIKEVKGKYNRVIYYHATIGHYADLDPFDTTRSSHIFGLNINEPYVGLHPNDLLVWDAHFGPNEGGTQVADLLNRKDLELVELIVPEERMEVLGGYPFEVYLFACREAERKEERQVLFDAMTGAQTGVQVRLDTLPCPGGPAVRCFQGTEFPMEFLRLPVDAPGSLYGELLVRAVFATEGDTGEEIKLVFSEENASEQLSYWSEVLRNGAFEHRFRVPPRTADVRNKMYIWNRTGKPIELKDLQVEVVHVVKQ